MPKPHKIYVPSAVEGLKLQSRFKMQIGIYGDEDKNIENYKSLDIYTLSRNLYCTEQSRISMCIVPEYDCHKH